MFYKVQFYLSILLSRTSIIIGLKKNSDNIWKSFLFRSKKSQKCTGKHLERSFLPQLKTKKKREKFSQKKLSMERQYKSKSKKMWIRGNYLILFQSSMLQRGEGSAHHLLLSFFCNIYNIVFRFIDQSTFLDIDIFASLLFRRLYLLDYASNATLWNKKIILFNRTDCHEGSGDAQTPKTVNDIVAPLYNIPYVKQLGRKTNGITNILGQIIRECDHTFKIVYAIHSLFNLTTPLST